MTSEQWKEWVSWHLVWDPLVLSFNSANTDLVSLYTSGLDALGVTYTLLNRKGNFRVRTRNKAGIKTMLNYLNGYLPGGLKYDKYKEVMNLHLPDTDLKPPVTPHENSHWYCSVIEKNCSIYLVGNTIKRANLVFVSKDITSLKYVQARFGGIHDCKLRITDKEKGLLVITSRNGLNHIINYCKINTPSSKIVKRLAMLHRLYSLYDMLLIGCGGTELEEKISTLLDNWKHFESNEPLELIPPKG